MYQVCDSKYDLKVHMEEHQKNDFDCDKCEFYCTNLNSLQEHEGLVHASDKAYMFDGRYVMSATVLLLL